MHYLSAYRFCGVHHIHQRKYARLSAIFTRGGKARRLPAPWRD